jgi:hypothetical protein
MLFFKTIFLILLIAIGLGAILKPNDVPAGVFSGPAPQARLAPLPGSPQPLTATPGDVILAQQQKAAPQDRLVEYQLN